MPHAFYSCSHAIIARARIDSGTATMRLFQKMPQRTIVGLLKCFLAKVLRPVIFQLGARLLCICPPGLGPGIPTEALAEHRRCPPRPPPAPENSPPHFHILPTSVVAFYPAPGTFMPARQNFIQTAVGRGPRGRRTVGATSKKSKKIDTRLTINIGCSGGWRML